MRWAGLFLIPLMICSCTRQLPFDKSLVGSYELVCTADAPEYLDILENGRFINSYGAGWLELYPGDILKLVYDDGVIEEAVYEKLQNVLDIGQGEDRLRYVEPHSLPLGGVESGKYIDNSASLMLEFEEDGSGCVRPLCGGMALPFSYRASGGIMRLAYGGLASASYEYLDYERVDGLLKLQQGDAVHVLFPEARGYPQGSYTLIYDHDLDDGFCMDKVVFLQSKACIDGLCYDAWIFSNNIMVLQKDSAQYTMEIGIQDSRLMLGHNGNQLQFISDSAFKPGAGFTGIYADDSLSTLFWIDEDSSGNYTKDGRGADFSCMSAGNILRCCAQGTDAVFYLEVIKSEQGIDIAELPRIEAHESGFTSFTKIG